MSVLGNIRSDRIHEDIEDIMAAANLLYGLHNVLIRELRDTTRRDTVAKQSALTLLTRAAWHIHGIREPYNMISRAL